MGGRGGSSHSVSSGGGGGGRGGSVPTMAAAINGQYGRQDFHGFYYNPSTRIAEQKHFAEQSFSQSKWNALSSAEQRGIYDYTGSYYTPINNALFGKNAADRATQRRIDDATKGLSKTKAEFDFIVVRGDWPRDTASLLGGTEAQLSDPAFLQAQIGKVVEFKGFMSSAITESDAWTWKGVTAWIAVPKGTEGLYVDPISANSGEKEWLFQRSTFMKVEWIKTNSAGKLVEIQYTVVPKPNTRRRR